MVLPAEVALRLVLDPLQIATPLLGVTAVGGERPSTTKVAEIYIIIAKIRNTEEEIDVAQNKDEADKLVIQYTQFYDRRYKIFKRLKRY